MTGVDDAHIGSVVRALRGEIGMSQADLIKVLNGLGLAWHQTTLVRLESGQRALRASELVPLAAALSTTPSDLLGVDLAVAAKRVKLRIARERLHAAGEAVARLEREPGEPASAMDLNDPRHDSNVVSETCCCAGAAVVQPCGPCRCDDHADCVGLVAS